MAKYIEVKEPKNLREELLPEAAESKPASAGEKGDESLAVAGEQEEVLLPREDQQPKAKEYDQAIIKSEIARFEKVAAEIKSAIDTNTKTHEAQQAASESTSWSLFAKPDMKVEDKACNDANNVNCHLRKRVVKVLALLKFRAKEAGIEGYDDAAIYADFSGIVTFGEDRGDERLLIITPQDDYSDLKEVLIPNSRSITAIKGEIVERGDIIVDGVALNGEQYNPEIYRIFNPSTPACRSANEGEVIREAPAGCSLM